MGDRNEKDELDAFWDLRRITPPRMTAFSDRCDPVEIVSDAPNAETGQNGKGGISSPEAGTAAVPERIPSAAVPPARAAKDVAHYTSISPFFCEVTVQTFPSLHTLCDRFLHDAEHYAQVAPPASAEPQPFYSHLPQYTQLSRAAMDWYLFWRAAFLRGETTDIADSYLLLFVFETLNLTPIHLSPQEGLDRLLRLWTVYREAHRVLDRCLSEWVCDFCLQYGLTLPCDLTESVRTAGISNCSLREFYLINSADCTVPAYLSDYDYRKSKFYAPNAAAYDTHIPHAIRAAGIGWLSDQTVCNDRCLRTIQRSCYIGAPIRRCRLEVSYYAVTRSPEAHRGATALYKYAENGVRRMLGIRSRLNADGLPVGTGQVIDAYFAPLIPKKENLPEPEPEYMAQYEPESADLDLSRVHQLERESWQVTSMLVPNAEIQLGDDAENRVGASAHGDAAERSVPSVSEEAAEEEVPPSDTTSDDLFRRAAALLLCGNTADFCDLAQRAGMLPATLMEGLNEKCLTLIGDIAFEGDGMAQPYHVIPCYRQDLEDWIDHANAAEL